MAPAPIPQPDGMITLVAYGCGPFRTLVNGVCMARTTVRQARRQARRCVRWRMVKRMHEAGGQFLLYIRLDPGKRARFKLWVCEVSG